MYIAARDQLLYVSWLPQIGFRSFWSQSFATLSLFKKLTVPLGSKVGLSSQVAGMPERLAARGPVVYGSPLKVGG